MIADIMSGLVPLGCFTACVWVVVLAVNAVRRGPRQDARAAAAEAEYGRIAQTLEQRVATLERILDAQVPAWRSMDFAVAREPHP